MNFYYLDRDVLFICTNYPYVLIKDYLFLYVVAFTLDVYKENAALYKSCEEIIVYVSNRFRHTVNRLYCYSSDRGHDYQ